VSTLLKITLLAATFPPDEPPLGCLHTTQALVSILSWDKAGGLSSAHRGRGGHATT